MVAGLGYKIKCEPGESSIIFYDFRTISVPFCWLEVSLSLAHIKDKGKRLQFSTQDCQHHIVRTVTWRVFVDVAIFGKDPLQYKLGITNFYYKNTP